MLSVVEQINFHLPLASFSLGLWSSSGRVCPHSLQSEELRLDGVVAAIPEAANTGERSSWL